MSKRPLPVLKEFRERQTPRWTQDDLAEKVGVSSITVSRWETGARKIDRPLLPLVSEKTGIPAREQRPELAELLEGVQ